MGPLAPWRTLSATTRVVPAAGRVQAYGLFLLIVTTLDALKLSVDSTTVVVFGRNPRTNGLQAPLDAIWLRGKTR
mgnify:CR=1 FL=1